MSAAPATTRVLVISPRADDRVETRVLLDVVHELRRRSDATVALWWLRGERGPADRVVDELRTGGGLALLDRVPVRALANGVRGRVLRRWLRATDPDWIVLDGGLGERAVTHASARRAVRVTNTPSVDTDAEGPPRRSADLWLLPPGTAATGDEPAVLELSPDLADRGDAMPFRSASARHIVRRRLGLPIDGPLVVGWSGDGRGAEQFTSVLADLGARHDVDATGLWLGDEPPASTAHEAVVLHHRTTRPLDVRLCGDAVVLVGDAPVDVSEAHDALVAGLPVLATAPASTAFDRDVREVIDLPHLVDDLHAVLAEVDDDGTMRRGEEAAVRLDLLTWTERFVAVLRAADGARSTGSAN